MSKSLFLKQFAWIINESLTSLFLKKKSRAIQSWSLFCQESDLTRAIWSRLLFFKERGERIAYSRSIIWAILSKKAKAQILNLAFYSILLFNQIFVIGYISNSSEGCRCTLTKVLHSSSSPTLYWLNVFLLCIDIL